MLPVVVSKNLIAASVSCVAAGQSLAAAGNLVLNGASASAQPSGPFGATETIATLDTARRIVITSAGNDSGRTFTITGRRQGGQTIRENLTGASGGAVVSVLDYLNVGQVHVDGAVATTVTVGTNGTGSTDWIMPNFDMTPFNVNIVDQITGTIGWNLETTNDIYWRQPMGPADLTPQPNVNKVIDGATTLQPATLASAVTGYRFTVVSGTGTIAAQCEQAGIANF